MPGLNRVSAGEYFSKVLFKPPLLYVSSPGTLLQGFKNRGTFRLSVWQPAMETSRNPAGYCVVLSYSMTSLLTSFNRLVVALAKSQDHRVSCGVFAFGTGFALILLVTRTFLFSARAIRTTAVASAGGDSAGC